MGRLLLLIAVLLPAGCSSAAGPAPPPPGHVLHRGDGYTLAHPAGWTERRTTDDRGAPLVELHGPAGPHGAYRGQVVVARRDRHSGTMRDQLLQARTLNALHRRQILADRPHRVPGAAEAHWIEAVYDDRSPEGATVQVRIVDVYVLTRKDTMIDFVVRAPAAEFARTGLPAVLASLRATP